LNKVEKKTEKLLTFWTRWCIL